MADEDDNPFEIDGAEAELHVEALMGWDGDPCECQCGCRRLRDEADDPRCASCREGRHWNPDVQEG